MSAEVEEEIDIAAIHAGLASLDRKIKLAEQHNEFLKELGLPLRS